MNVKKSEQGKSTMKTFAILLVIVALILTAVIIMNTYGPETKAAAVKSKCSQIEMHILRAVASEGSFTFKISEDKNSAIKEIIVKVNGNEITRITNIPTVMQTEKVNAELMIGQKIQLMPVLNDGSSCGSLAEITAS